MHFTSWKLLLSKAETRRGVSVSEAYSAFRARKADVFEGPGVCASAHE